MPSEIITIFTASKRPRREPSSFAVSIAAHSLIAGFIFLGVTRRTLVVDDQFHGRETVKLLQLHMPPAHNMAAAPGGLTYAGDHSTGRREGEQAATSSLPRQMTQLLRAPQTIVQPDVPPDTVIPKEIPIPSALLWSSTKRRSDRIAPLPPHEANSADITPSLDPPNDQVNLADLKISATPFTTVRPAPPPSTSSPVAVSGPTAAHRVPETASKTAEAPQPSAVISVSELQMNDGIVALPRVNEVAPASASGSMTAGHGESANSNSASKQEGENGAGDSSANQAGSDRDGGNKCTTNCGSPGKNGISLASGQALAAAAASGDGSANGLEADHFTLPKNGHFGVVVVGSSLADQYPETVGIWGGRLAYTVYVHSGQAKNWILQYSLPRSADAAAAGSNERPDAPWPFYIVVPHVAPDDVNADAIMIHGFVNSTGHFEQLAVVSPPEFPHNDFVIASLQEWKFRPATQNGQVTRVEVLLIIPEEPN